MPLEESDADTDLKDKKQGGEVVGEGRAGVLQAQETPPYTPIGAW